MGKYYHATPQMQPSRNIWNSEPARTSCHAAPCRHLCQLKSPDLYNAIVETAYGIKLSNEAISAARMPSNLGRRRSCAGKVPAISISALMPLKASSRNDAMDLLPLPISKGLPIKNTTSHRPHTGIRWKRLPKGEEKRYGTMGVPNKSGYIYKATTNGDLVVHRMIHLYSDDGKFQTFHDFNKDPRNKKSWYLDRRCVLSPENAADISDQPQRKLERERGTWTITATATGSGREVNLYLLTIAWPSTWFQSGYSTFTFGLESLEEARAWHATFSECIQKLRSRRMQAKKAGDSSSLAGDMTYQRPLSSEVISMACTWTYDGLEVPCMS